MAGHYAALLRRAREKHAYLRASGMEEPSLTDTGLTRDELVRWYFAQRLGRTVPEDLGRYAEDLGYKHPGALLATLVREYLWSIPGRSGPAPGEH